MFNTKFVLFVDIQTKAQKVFVKCAAIIYTKGEEENVFMEKRN